MRSARRISNLSGAMQSHSTLFRSIALFRGCHIPEVSRASRRCMCSLVKSLRWRIRCEQGNSANTATGKAGFFATTIWQRYIYTWIQILIEKIACKHVSRQVTKGIYALFIAGFLALLAQSQQGTISDLQHPRGRTFFRRPANTHIGW